MFWNMRVVHAKSGEATAKLVSEEYLERKWSLAVTRPREVFETQAAPPIGAADCVTPKFPTVVKRPVTRSRAGSRAAGPLTRQGGD